MNQTALLVDFLASRLDEDENSALAASPGPWHLNDEHDEVLAVDDIKVCDAYALASNQLRNTARHISRFDPERTLREVEAKRAIVKRHQPYQETVTLISVGTFYPCKTCGDVDDQPDPWPCHTLRHLAAVYSDHRDYREEWKHRD